MSEAPRYGTFLRSVRASRSLSQADLAALTGIDQPNLSAYENDRHSPTLDILNRILVACGYELIAGAGPRQIRCPLPRAGWFPDDDLPQALPDPDHGHGVATTSLTDEDRGRAAYELLALADAVRWS